MPVDSATQSLLLSSALASDHSLRVKEVENIQADQIARVRRALVVGNAHELVKSAKPSRTGGKLKNSHRWTMKVAIHDDDTSRFIEKVVFKLHPTFKMNTVEVKQAPFQLSKIGWGEFEIGIEVHFKRALRLPPKVYTHDLAFDDNGSYHREMIDFGLDNKSYVQGKVFIN
jgi:YEATS domain-containing protein 4